MAPNSKAPLTHEQKLQRGYEHVATVGPVPLYLTPGDLKRVKAGVSNRDALIKYKIDQETAAQAGTAEQNAKQEYEITAGGRFRCKQSGTRNWITMNKAKLREFLDRRAEIEAIYAKMPDSVVVAVEDEE